MYSCRYLAIQHASCMLTCFRNCLLCRCVFAKWIWCTYCWILWFVQNVKIFKSIHFALTNFKEQNSVRLFNCRTRNRTQKEHVFLAGFIVNNLMLGLPDECNCKSLCCPSLLILGGFYWGFWAERTPRYTHATVFFKTLSW